MRHVLVTGLLLAAFGLAACGDDEPAPPAGEVPPWARVAPEQIAEARTYGVPVAFENDLGMRFVLIPAGTFVMGSPEEEEGRVQHELVRLDEWPDDTDEIQHEVRIPRPFYMQLTELSNAEYRRFRTAHVSSAADGADDPVAEVSHEDAVALCRWLSGRSHARAYRLPSEAEWEYACRAGTRTRFSSGDTETDLDRVGWYRANAFGHPHAVGRKPANRWGLHDMHGNVWEWCQDAYRPYEPDAESDLLVEVCLGGRVFRGGAWDSPGSGHARSANREAYIPGHRDDSIGFRLVSPLPEK